MAAIVPGQASGSSNPSTQNGYFHFVQDTAPTQRSTGVPLVAGDRWTNPSTRRQGFWQSPYWLSQQEYCVADLQRSLTASNTPSGQVLAPELNHDSIIIEAVAFGIRTAITADGSNTWQVQPRYDSSGAINIPGSLMTINTNLAAYAEIVVSLSVPVLLSSGCRYFFPPSFTKTGSPSGIEGVCTYKYRLIL